MASLWHPLQEAGEEEPILQAGPSGVLEAKDH